MREKWGPKGETSNDIGWCLQLISHALPAKDFSAFVPLSIDPSKSVCFLLEMCDKPVMEFGTQNFSARILDT